MKPLSLIAMCTVLIAGMLSLGAMALADSEENISADELPAAIQKALEGVKLSEVERETHGDVVVYEVEFRVGQSEVCLELNEIGQLLAVEVEDDDDEDEDDDGEEEDEVDA